MATPDELATLLQSLRQFPADVAHDLRSALAGIGLLARVAQEHLQRGDVASAGADLERLAHQAQRSQMVLDALLRLADPLERPLQPTGCALDEVARAAADEAVLSVQAYLPGRRLPPVHLQPLGSARVDRGLLHVILINLIGNALKFNLDQDGVSVRVGRDDTGADAGLAVVVSDDGTGFDPNLVLQPQGPNVHPDSSAGVSGHGLGLDIVRRAAERMGGRLEVHSMRGRGTTARVVLPPS